MEKPFTMETVRESDEDSSLAQSWESPQCKEVDSMDSPNPQDWSPTRKTLLFLALMSSSLLADGYAPADIAHLAFLGVCVCLFILTVDPGQWFGDQR